jgi:hypothetical protein
LAILYCCHIGTYIHCNAITVFVKIFTIYQAPLALIMMFELLFLALLVRPLGHHAADYPDTIVKRTSAS